MSTASNEIDVPWNNDIFNPRDNKANNRSNMAPSQRRHEYGLSMVSSNRYNDVNLFGGTGMVHPSRNQEINGFRHNQRDQNQAQLLEDDVLVYPYSRSSPSSNSRTSVYDDQQHFRTSMLQASAGGPVGSNYIHRSRMHDGTTPSQSLYDGKETTQERHDVYFDLVSNVHELPGAIESETSSFDNSFEDDEIPFPYKGHKKNDIYQHVSPNNSFNRYPHEYQYDEGYNHHNMSRCEPTYPASTGRNVAALASYEMKFKHNSDKSSDTVTAKCKMIEIAPGEYMKLRGAEETWKAIQNDFYLPCCCVCCNLTLFCIQDATYVLCPECQVVSSLEKLEGFNGGVGLGFTMEELAEWQNDIVMNRGM
jgi:hypothetical protein